MKNKQIMKVLSVFALVTMGVAFAANACYADTVSTNSTTLLTVFKPAMYLTGDYIQGATTTMPTNDELIDGERTQRLDNYFAARSMPLAGYGKYFVEAAKKCDIDWRLLPAIGVRESSGGKHLMNNNPFGWGSAKIKFVDFADAIDGVSDNLCGLNPGTARYYADKTTYERLWYYNGTVLPTYPKEVMDIMDMM